MRILAPALVLAACAKQPSTAPTPDPAPSSAPAGMERIDAPSNFKSLRPLASAVLPDGTYAIGGAAVRLVQYQWLLRTSPTGGSSQTVFDPGRIQWLDDNGTAGLDAVGTLGGVPEDKAWYGDIDAFGKLGTRQTYLSDGNGQFFDLVRLEDGLVAGGEVMTADGTIHGWLVRTDQNGRDLWKTQIGETKAQGLTWLEDQGGTLVGGGWQLDTSEDPWVVAADSSGKVLLDTRWDDPGWTRLTSGVVHGSGDLVVAGLSAPTEAGSLDGTGSLWVGRITADGTKVWDRQERSDLSVVTRAIAWKDGIAIAALKGPYGTRRKVVVATVTADGSTTWTEPEIPAGVGWAQVHATGGKLVVLATIAQESSLSHGMYPL